MQILTDAKKKKKKKNKKIKKIKKIIKLLNLSKIYKTLFWVFFAKQNFPERSDSVNF